MPVIFSELQIASFFSQLFFVFKSNLLDQLFSDGFQVHLHIKLWKKCLSSDSQQFYQYQQNKECLSSDSQQFYQYQQNKECLSSDSQQFYQYQQNKECLNSDSQQFYQYQQCQQSPLTLTQVRNRKKTTTYNDVWNSCPISGQAHKSGRIKLVMMGFQVHVVVYNTCILFYSTMSTCISML
jgi:hypothetical protein